MENILQETKFIMKKYKIKANKSLGQNFLVDEKVLDAIVVSSEISKDDLVIEIGPGLGTLTRYLLEKAGKVICIELDKKMVGILNDRFSLYDNFEIINNDVLKVDLNKLIEEKRENFKDIKIVANLPYYITTPIVMKLIESNLNVRTITVMIQKEVAERLIAIPGTKEAGAITYSVYYRCKGEKVLEVLNDSFIPRPDVTSEVIKLTLREKPQVSVDNEKIMFHLIKSAFMQRRKTLLNSLTNAGAFMNKRQGEEILQKLKLDTNIRAENLSLQNFADIANYLCNVKSN